MISEIYLNRNSVERKSKKSLFTKGNFFVFLFLIIVSFFIFYTFQNKNNGSAIFNPLAEIKKLQEEPPPPPKPKRKPDEAKKVELLEEVRSILVGNKIFGVSIIDMEIDDSFGINQDQVFHAASVMKVLVATAVLEEIETGKISLNQPLGSYDVEFQLKQMINQSNNTSWDYFNNLLGWEREQKTADRLGMTGTKVWGNHMTARDSAKLLKNLYQEKSVKKESKDLLFSFMQNTETENRISKAIPTGIKFYHKTGTYEGGLHDVAIIDHPKHPFILSIFTNDVYKNYEIRAKSLEEAARAVYNFFDTLQD